MTNRLLIFHTSIVQLQVQHFNNSSHRVCMSHCHKMKAAVQLKTQTQRDNRGIHQTLPSGLPPSTNNWCFQDATKFLSFLRVRATGTDLIITCTHIQKKKEGMTKLVPRSISNFCLSSLKLLMSTACSQNTTAAAVPGSSVLKLNPELHSPSIMEDPHCHCSPAFTTDLISVTSLLHLLG